MDEKIKLTCKTPRPVIRIEGFGEYKDGDEVVFPRWLANQLLAKGDEIQWVKAKIEKSKSASSAKKEGE